MVTIDTGAFLWDNPGMDNLSYAPTISAKTIDHGTDWNKDEFCSAQIEVRVTYTLGGAGNTVSGWGSNYQDAFAMALGFAASQIPQYTLGF